MSFKINDCQQLSLDDSFMTLTQRGKALEKSWAKIFADEIFPSIDEERFSVIYSDKTARPNAPVNVIIGALIIKNFLIILRMRLLRILCWSFTFNTLCTLQTLQNSRYQTNL